MSTPTATASSSTQPANRYALTAIEKQRGKLEKLLKDPQKPAYIAPPPKQKTIRPPREMMTNVQGSSAGAGSGEFHVYKASRRREYERLKLLEETTQKVNGNFGAVSVFLDHRHRSLSRQNLNERGAKPKKRQRQKRPKTARSDKRKRIEQRRRVQAFRAILKYIENRMLKREFLSRKEDLLTGRR